MISIDYMYMSDKQDVEEEQGTLTLACKGGHMHVLPRSSQAQACKYMQRAAWSSSPSVSVVESAT